MVRHLQAHRVNWFCSDACFAVAGRDGYRICHLLKPRFGDQSDIVGVIDWGSENNRLVTICFLRDVVEEHPFQPPSDSSVEPVFFGWHPSFTDGAKMGRELELLNMWSL